VKKKEEKRGLMYTDHLIQQSITFVFFVWRKKAGKREREKGKECGPHILSSGVNIPSQPNMKERERKKRCTLPSYTIFLIFFVGAALEKTGIGKKRRKY